jgi:hypothetical protein
METKKLVEKKIEKYAYSDIITYNVPDYVHFIHKFPYRTFRYMNSFYFYICQFIEPNTNKLVIYDGKRVAHTATLDILAVLSNMSFPTFKVNMSILVGDGIIGLFKVGGLTSYYVNPYFAIAGDRFPKMLQSLFQASDGEVFGEHLFAPDGEWYNDNRNLNYRFGCYKSRLLNKRHLSTDIKDRIAKQLKESPLKKRGKKDPKQYKRKSALEE